MNRTLSGEKINWFYKTISSYHDKYLKQHRVKMPKLRGTEGFTKGALTLIYLAQDYPNTRKVSKQELTAFRTFYPEVADVQQARHLAQQKGWYTLSGTRGNSGVRLQSGEYQLITLEKPYPAFKGHRIYKTDDWEILKSKYGYRCATCGSEEGRPNIHYPNTITQLQASHIDPSKQLVSPNIIPQCQKCNRAYRDFWEFDERGRVRKLANPIVIKRSHEKVRWSVYKLLYEEFNGRNPLK